MDSLTKLTTKILLNLVWMGKAKKIRTTKRIAQMSQICSSPSAATEKIRHEIHALMRMWSNWDSHPLLVGVYNSATMLGNSFAGFFFN